MSFVTVSKYNVDDNSYKATIKKNANTLSPILQYVNCTKAMAKRDTLSLPEAGCTIDVVSVTQ